MTPINNWLIALLLGFTFSAPTLPPPSASVCGNSPWTITAESLVEMAVTDAFPAGDSFDVFDFGVLIGLTSSVAAGRVIVA